jgi:hypothetical protein
MKTLRVSCLLLALIAALAAAGPALAASTQTVTVNPDVGPPGTRFLFFANGFTPGERLSFWLNRPDGQTQAAAVADLQRANSDGSGVWSWTAPSDAARGAWQMVAHGRTSGVEAVIAFAIGDTPVPDAGQPFNVEPRSGAPGTLFRFFASGFNPGEYVEVRVRQPDGAEVTDGLVVAEPASASGRIDGSWTSPSNAATGSWQIVARGAASGIVRAIPITIGAPTTAPARLDVSPDVGSRGMRFSFSATGFAPDEQIGIWLNLPDGRVVAAEVEGVTRAAPDGRAGWTWVAPADGPLGSWQMVAHGTTSGVEVVASFVLR